MTLKLVIAEKPDVALHIAEVLGIGKKERGYFTTKSDYVVSYALGHLVGLAEPQEYNPSFQSWRKEDLPIVPERFKLSILGDSKKGQFLTLKRLLSQASEVVVATDSGREGQLIYQYIANLAGYHGAEKRLWMQSLTPEAIKSAFSTMKDNKEYQALYVAAECRSRADWLLGINCTRAMSLQGGATLSLGRVQTPTLAIVVKRDKEIRDFVKEPYYEFISNFSVETGAYQGKWERNGVNRTSDRTELETLMQSLEGKQGVIAVYEQKEEQEQPPQLFDLTTLERTASRKFGYSPDVTDSILQALYEEHKILTYPRTDSRYITPDIVPTLKSRLLAATACFPELRGFFKDIQKPTKRILDFKESSDHHAIIPTEKEAGELSEKERNIYGLVVQQLFMALMKPATFSTTSIITKVGEENFKTNGKIMIEPGYRTVKDLELTTKKDKKPKRDTEEIIELPTLRKGQTAYVTSYEILDKMTQEPPHLTDDTLLGAMDHAGTYVDDKDLSDALRERGLGTPATRANIIKGLKEDGYIRQEKGRLIATEKGIQLIESLPVPELTSPELTGEWELKLRKIEHKEYSARQFMTEINEMVHRAVRDILNTHIERSFKEIETEDKTIGNCPRCGKGVLEQKTFYGCSGWKDGCKFSIKKEILGHKLTRAQVKELLDKRKTKSMTFTSEKTRKPFTASLVMDDTGKISFQFAQTKGNSKASKSKS